MGKVRNQSPGEQPDVDTDKLGLSLSICLNDIDAQVGSLEEAAHTEPRCICYCCCRAVERKVFPIQVCLMKFVQFKSKVNILNKKEYWQEL